MKKEELLGNLDVNTLFVGDRSVILPEIRKHIFEKYGETNVSIFEIEKLNIAVADIRRMISGSFKTSDNKSFVLLSSFYWSDEVQNAMLKVLEETPKNTFIFLFGNSIKPFLPTILSRIQKKESKKTNRYLKTAKEILSLVPNERLENKAIKKILSLKVTDINYQNNQENEKKDREAHILLIDALIETLLENKQLLSKDYLEKLLKISTVYDIEGGSPHLFIEWLLLSAPKLE